MPLLRSLADLFGNHNYKHGAPLGLSEESRGPSLAGSAGGPVRAAADCKSAIQQIENLRYFWIGPGARGSRAEVCFLAFRGDAPAGAPALPGADEDDSARGRNEGGGRIAGGVIEVNLPDEADGQLGVGETEVVGG